MSNDEWESREFSAIIFANCLGCVLAYVGQEKEGEFRARGLVSVLAAKIRNVFFIFLFFFYLWLCNFLIIISIYSQNIILFFLYKIERKIYISFNSVFD